MISRLCFWEKYPILPKSYSNEAKRGDGCDSCEILLNLDIENQPDCRRKLENIYKRNSRRKV